MSRPFAVLARALLGGQPQAAPPGKVIITDKHPPVLQRLAVERKLVVRAGEMLHPANKPLDMPGPRSRSIRAARRIDGIVFLARRRISSGLRY